MDNRRVLVCDCNGTIRLDDLGDAPPATELCRSDIGRFHSALKDGASLVVACRQEMPLFKEIVAESKRDCPVAYIDIRDRAGWSEQADAAGPKIAALLAETETTIPAVPAVALSSTGVAVVLGRDETALAAARMVADRLSVSVVVQDTRDLMPCGTNTVPVHRGRVAKASGHLGAFRLVLDDHAPHLPSGRGPARFVGATNGVELRCDIIVDLTGDPPLFPDHWRRDGYVRRDPSDPAAVNQGLLEATGLVGEFEKPRYVSVQPEKCAHSRNQKTGCTRCLEVCPTGALTPNGASVRIDPHVCAGCGSCAATCPTGAVAYQLPPNEQLFLRLRTLLMSYRQHGGRHPVLLVHDTDGFDTLSAGARHGRGLPANVLPFAVNEATQLGFDHMAVALAYGAEAIAFHVPRKKSDEAAGLRIQTGHADALCQGLGLGTGRTMLIETDDPDAIADTLYALRPTPGVPAADFLVMGSRREAARMALSHLHAHAPAGAEIVAMPAGSPFGTVALAAEGCTLCMSCVEACPTKALRSNTERPQLSFVEQACIQCGLCRATCPERALSLESRLSFAAEARSQRILKEESPATCVECGKPFGVASMIRRMADNLADKHPMFMGEAAKRLWMCEDCRVVVQFKQPDPMSAGPARRPRTTEDDLRERGSREPGLS